MTEDELRQVALRGIGYERKALHERLEELDRQEQELRPRRGRRQAAAAAATNVTTTASIPPRKSYHMSTAARKAVSERMRRYWAERRKQSKQK